MKVFLSLFLITFLFIASVYSQVTINVPGDYPTIQAAINAANNGDLVLVADGTYTENINFMGKAITVASHFINDGDKSRITNTIIDGSQPLYPDSASVVTFRSGEDTNSVLCGFTITGGTGTLSPSLMTRAGGGIVVYLSGAKICNNIIEFNSLNYPGNNAFGGGILVYENYTTIINNNIIRNNSINGTYPFGGGISLGFSGLTYILSNKIIDNEAIGNYASGGGIDVSNISGEVVINGNYIKGNDAQVNGWGGGGIDLYNWGALITVSNNLIVDNSARWGGGILVEYNPELSGKSKSQNLSTKFLEQIPCIVNNTIINNSAAIVGGIYGRGSTPDVMNNIVWGNTYSSGGQIYGANVTWSDVEGGYTGLGNIDDDPEFIDSLYFCLCDTSGCIDMGNPDPMYNDVEDPNNPGYALFPAMGNLRNDMGAFGGPNSTWSSIILDTLRVPTDYATIQEAIDAAMEGNVVLVAEGTYYENINYKGKAITVASHFLVDGNEAHIENTIIDGSQPTDPDSASVVTFRNGEDTNSVICGFTITGGTGTIVLYNGLLRRYGGGVLAYYSDAKIQHNIIESNNIQYTSDSFGGGICGFYGDYIIENNIIRNNEINTPSIVYYSLGGGIYTTSLGYVRIENNKILNNTITAPEAWGGGIVPAGLNDNYFIINNLISGNTIVAGAGGSGGIDIYSHSPTVKNNVIVYNSAPRGGGVVIENATPIFSNNTIAFNASTVSGGGLDIVSLIPQITCCIVWGNSAPIGAQINGNANVDYSDIQGGGFIGPGNIDTDPLFRDTPNNDFHLQSTDCGDNFISPCIDAGNPAYRDSIMDCDWGLGSQDICDMGAYSVAVLISGVSDEDNILPEDYVLFQNYPNPFNPTTTIKYGIKKRSFVELKLYDILGREVTTFINEEQDAGYYEIEFNASTLASGVYFYRIQAGSFIETKKMVLMK